MSDVARRTGVHVATVSRALRDDPRITTAQRARIRRAAAELGYRTNPLVAALMSARRGQRPAAYQATIACVTSVAPERAAWFRRDFGSLLTGVRERAEADGYRLDEFNLHDLSAHPHRATEILLSRGIHGLLIAPLYSVHVPVLIDWSRFAAVAVGYSLSHVAVTRVAHNHFGAMGVVARKCREAGRRRLGLVVQRRVHEKVAKRWVAATLLEQSEQAAGDRIPPLLLDELDLRPFATWLERHRPDAIACLDTTSVLGWLKQLGCGVPRDVAVVSLDRRPRDRGLAGIDQDYAGLGAVSVELLVNLLHRNQVGLPQHPPTVLLDGAWVDGRSLGSVAIR